MRPKRELNTPKTKSAEQALASLMALCARAERSSGDAYRLMSRWGVEPSQQEAILKRLIDERFIDDERYTAAYVREKINLNGWGAYKIRTELRRKGVANEIIEEQLSQLDRDKLRERLDTLITKRLRTVKYTSKRHLMDKLIRYGASQGYDFSTVNDAVRDAISRLSFTEEDDMLV